MVGLKLLLYKKKSTNASEKKHKTPNEDKRQNVQDELSKPYQLLFISQRYRKRTEKRCETGLAS